MHVFIGVYRFSNNNSSGLWAKFGPIVALYLVSKTKPNHCWSWPSCHTYTANPRMPCLIRTGHLLKILI